MQELRAKLALLLIFAISLAQSQVLGEEEVPHHLMMGTQPRPGTDALHPKPDQMRASGCDGVAGATPQSGNFWPSPHPAPSVSPQPPPKEVLSNSPGSNSPARQCTDDESFTDSATFSCRDYTMNKELCNVADRYANPDGRTARHACCKCGGGKHVQPSTTVRCVRQPMGEDCIEKDKYTTLRDVNGDVMVKPAPSEADSLPMAPTDAEIPEEMGHDSADDTVAEDQVDDDPATAVDNVLEPDALVFRDRNFVGYPSEPENLTLNRTIGYAVVGSFKFGLRFYSEWESDHGPSLIMGLADLAEVEAHHVSLTSVQPPGVVVRFRITPAEFDPSKDAATLIVRRLNQGFSSGSFMSTLDQLAFPKTNFTVLARPTIEEVLIPIGYVNAHNQYKTNKYTVGPKETIESIAEKFHITSSLLVAFNEWVADPMLLKTGDVLLIPRPRIVQITRVAPLRSPLEGGVDIVVSGRGFVFPAFCKIGNIISPATHVVDDLVVCPAPAQKDPGSYDLLVSDGKEGFELTPFSIQYTVGWLPFCDEPGARRTMCRPRIGIYSVSPLRLPESTPANITIIGIGFNSSTVCRIGGEIVPSTVKSRRNITCHFTGKGPSQNSIVLEQGSAVATTKFELTIFSTLTLTELSPKYGPDSSATEVTLEGTSFKQGIVCHFGASVAIATVISDTRITCLAPAHGSGITKVEVRYGDLVASKSLEFEYTHLQLLNLSSTIGSFRGHDLITLTGHGFYPGLFCRFGTTVVPALYLGPTTARCEVPPQSVSKVVKVHVSLDGVSGFSEEDHEYHYVADITEIRPAEGRSIGGDDIHIFGNGFDPDCSYVCRFGNISVPATVITSTQVQCTSPPGTGRVHFSLDSKDLTFAKNILGKFLEFTYHSAGDVDLFALFPPFADVRVANVSVVLSGTGFLPGTMCRFGDQASVSHYVSETTIKCNAPTQDTAQIVTVSVSRDGGKSWSGDLVRFEYRAVVEDVVPPVGPVQGGNVVIVKGYGFNVRTSLCVFGNKVVPAAYRTQFEVSCVVPISEAPARVPFAVTTNDTVLYDRYLEFKFSHPDAAKSGTFYVYSRNPGFFVRSVQPDNGSIFGGNTVTVLGDGFDQSSHCMFGDRAVKAVVRDSSTLNCVVPPHPPATLPFEVVNMNRKLGFNTTAIGKTYSFVAPTIVSVDPSDGFVTGGEMVRIAGTHLSGAITCKFGPNSSPVTRVTATEVLCEVPPSTAFATVNVELGYGSAGSSNSGAIFTYHPAITGVAPQNGIILTDAQVTTFHGKGFSGEPILCAFENKFFVPATVKSDSQLDCVVPVASQPHTAQLKLTNAARNLVLGKQIFDFKYHPKIQTLFPTFGPTTGGTTVVVVGSGFAAVTHCSFGADRVVALVISDLMVRCKSPPQTAGNVKLSLVAETGSKETNFNTNAVDFKFKVMTTRVEVVHPNSGSIGGGTFVTIRGSGFSMGSLCKFGDQVTSATFLSQDSIGCYSPPVDKPQTVSVEVSQSSDGDDFSEDGNTFTYGANISTVTRIDPAFGEPGATIDVFGDSFEELSSCFFGGRRSVSTTFVSATHLKCEIPRMGSKIVEVVQVASSPTLLTGGHVVFHYDVPLSDKTTIAVREVIPNHGPTTGGVNVTVFGVNFPDNAFCQFGDVLSAAVFVSRHELHCLSPAHRVASVPLEIVSRNRAAFSASLIRFTYDPTTGPETDELLDFVTPGTPEITQMTPTFGRPGDQLTLVGTKFSSVGFCVFYNTLGSLLSSATVLDSSHVSCEVPELISDMGSDVLVKYLSIGGAQSENVEFKYIVS